MDPLSSVTLEEVEDRLRRIKDKGFWIDLEEKIKKLKVLVLGDLILDRWIIGKVTRISPEAPVPIVNAYKRRVSLGGAANVARNLRALGAQVTVLGVVGRDRYGKLLERLMAQEGITPKLVASRERRTTLKTRIVADNNHQICRIDWEETRPLSRNEFNRLIEAMRELEDLKSFHLIVISDYAKGTLTPEVIEALGKHKDRIFAGPKPKNITMFEGIRLLSLNRSEFIDSFKRLNLNGEAQISEEALLDPFYSVSLERKLMRTLNLKELIVTKGPKGMTVHSHAESYHVPALARSVYDVTGAGDTVLATYSSFSYLLSDPLLSAMLSTISAGLSVSKFGTNAISWKELMDHALSLREKDSNRLGKVKIYS